MYLHMYMCVYEYVFMYIYIDVSRCRYINTYLNKYLYAPRCWLPLHLSLTASLPLSLSLSLSLALSHHPSHTLSQAPWTWHSETHPSRSRLRPSSRHRFQPQHYTPTPIKPKPSNLTMINPDSKTANSNSDQTLNCNSDQIWTPTSKHGTRIPTPHASNSQPETRIPQLRPLIPKPSTRSRISSSWRWWPPRWTLRAPEFFSCEVPTSLYYSPA